MKRRWMMIVAATATIAACAGPAEQTAPGAEDQPAAEVQIEMVVRGLECPLCVDALERRLAEVEGSVHTGVELETGRVTVGLSEGHGLDAERLRELVEAAGFQLTEVSRAPWLEDAA